MPDATFLHIQTRESASPRVIELTGKSIRIGRGIECDVRLDEPALAEIQCILNRRGASWQVEPIGPPGRVFLDGQAVDRLRSVPYGSRLKIGRCWITIRSGCGFAASLGAMETPEATDTEILISTNVPPADPCPLNANFAREPSLRPSPEMLPSEVEPDAEQKRLEQWQAWSRNRRQSLKDRAKELRWEARWRAVGQNLRAQSAAAGRSSSSSEGKDRSQERHPAGAGSTRHVPKTPLQSSVAGHVAKPVQDGAEFGAIRDLTNGRSDSSSIAPNRDDSSVRRFREPSAGGTPPFEPREERASDCAQAKVTDPGSIQGPAQTAPPPTSVDGSQSDRSPISEQIGSIFEISHVVQQALEAPEFAPVSHDVGDGEQESSPIPPGLATSLASDGAISGDNWPRVKDVLLAHASHEQPQPKKCPVNSNEFGSDLTIGQPPRSWTISARMITPALLGLSLCAGFSASWLTWKWAEDQRLAAGLANLLLKSGRPSSEFPPPPESPALQWWMSTSRNVLLHAAAHGLAEPGADREERVESLVMAARRIGPLDPAVRVAMFNLGSTEASSSLASRDVATLHRHANRLRDQGAIEEALQAYRLALELAASADPEDDEPPQFLEDSRIRRFKLPLEQTILSIVQDMSVLLGQHPERWRSALPSSPLVSLVAYRVLSERRDPLAREIADAALTAIPSCETVSGLIQRAAQAEIMALENRFEDSAEAYRQALEHCDAKHDETRRLLAYNLADLEARLGDFNAMEACWRLARSSDLRNPVNVRLAEARKILTGGGQRTIPKLEPIPKDNAVLQATYHERPTPRP